MGTVRFDFTNENFIVTGASSGMGRQIATELASAGATVMAVARRRERLEELAASFPGHIVPTVCDVCDREQLLAAVDAFVAEHGKFSGTVHAAGNVMITTLRAYDREAAHQMMETTFWAAVDMLQIVVRNKYAVKGSSHVLFSSTDAWSCYAGKFAYAASKASVNAAVKSLAKEIGPKGHHRINAVMPGWVNTEMTSGSEEITNKATFTDREILGLGKATDVSGMVLFLLSERAGWMTGACLPVDGGFTA